MSSKKPKQPAVIDLNRPHHCEFCHKSFAKESTLISHPCEPRRRHQNQNVSYVRKAHLAWQLFHQSLSPVKKGVPIKSYQEFSASNLYTAFVKFGSWCEEQQIQEFNCFVHWLLKNNVKLDAWCDRIAYDSYLKELVDSESSEQAISRSLTTIHRWALETNHPWQQFFSIAGTNLIVGWVTQGRISPWVLFNCDSAVGFLERCTPEQLMILQNTAPIRKWKIKLMRDQTTADIIKSTLKDAGL
jgi:hypothetical protein